MAADLEIVPPTPSEQRQSPRGAPTSVHSSDERTGSPFRGVERLDSIESSVFDSTSSKYMSQNYRRAAGASYVLAMGVCGIVLVALSSSLKDLAEQVDRTSIEIGAVFLTRGVGASIGNLISAKLYTWVRGKIAVSVTLFLLAVSLIWMPLARDVGTLHLNFLAIGFLTAIVDTGCQLMTRRLYGSAAGPWLGANTVAFGLCGAISPLIGWLTGSLVVEYSILAAVTFIIGFVLVVLPRPDSQPSLREEKVQVVQFKIPQGWTNPRAFYQANKINFHLCGIMFWFMGGRVAATAFLRQFADDTSESPQASLLIVCFWLAISFGRIVGLRDQLTMTLARLYRHATALCVAGAVATGILLFFYWNVAVLWVTVMLYGVLNGPMLGYAYDLSTRVSPSLATSAMVAIFGITAGASVVPFLASFTWDVTGAAFFLPLFLTVSHVIPAVLLRDIKKHYGESSARTPVAEADIAVVVPTPTFGAPPSPTSGWSPTGSAFDEGEEERASGTWEDDIERT